MTTNPPQRAVLTIATGKQVYIDMAITLARSFLRWNRNAGIVFQLATDSLMSFPEDLADIHVMRFAPGELGVGFSMKLKLDQLAEAQQTLFIDADCLVTGPLAPVFDRFAGNAVSVVGDWVTEGEWFGDIKRTREEFGLNRIPKFNGGVYYLEPGDIANAVYARARQIETRYDDIGLVRLRDCPNEELLMAISLAEHGCVPIRDDGSIHGDLFAHPILRKIDVLRGETKLSNPASDHPMHREHYEVREISPVIVHFLGDFTSKWPYKSQELMLKLVALGAPGWLARLIIGLSYAWPSRAAELLRDAFRPLYRKLFGTRRLRFEERF